MSYTEQRENALFSSWEYDVGDDDYSNVLQVLNTEFRTFGEGLLELMEKKAQKEIPSPIEHLSQKCEENRVPMAAIGSLNSLKNWFRGSPRPDKGEASRHKMFALAFALELTPEETAELFHKVYLDRAFNQRNYKECIYYHCLSKHRSFQEAEDLISGAELSAGADDKTVYTAYLAKETARISKDEELLSYIKAHGHNFSLNCESAKAVLCQMKEKALLCAQQYALQRKGDPLLCGKDKSSDSFLYSIITERTVAGEKGTVTVSFKNTVFPKEIKNNFPQVKSFSEKVGSYEELRKTIILLFSYWFWSEAQRVGIINIYDDYTAQLNDLLIKSNLAELYYGNPYDWMFLYCTYSDLPLDAFRGILSEVLDEKDGVSTKVTG